MSGIKPQTVKIVSILRNEFSSENSFIEANKPNFKTTNEHYDIRDLRLQELQDCQKVYKIVKKETTTKWILLIKLDECLDQIKLEIQFLLKMIYYVRDKFTKTEEQNCKLNQLWKFISEFENFISQAERNQLDKKQKAQQLKLQEFEDRQSSINEWKKIINKQDISQSQGDWKQIQLKVLDEVLTSYFDCKMKILKEPDSIDDLNSDSDKVLFYQNQINELRKKLGLDQFKRSRKQFDEFQQIIDNFDYKIPKMQEMNQFNLTQLKEMKRKLKAKSKSNLSQIYSTKSSPRKEQNSFQQPSDVELSLLEYQKEKQRISKIDKYQYKQDIKESQREVFIARINQGSIQRLSQTNKSFELNNKNQNNKVHREHIISMINGSVLKPYTPHDKSQYEKSKETCPNSRINESQSRRQSIRNVSPLSLIDRVSDKLNKKEEENEKQNQQQLLQQQQEKQEQYPQLFLKRQNAQSEKFNSRLHKFRKQQYNQNFVQKINKNEMKLVNQCKDFYTTRMKFNDKFSQLVCVLQNDRPLTSSIRQRSLSTNQNQRQEKIEKIRKDAEKARYNFFCRNKEQRLWHKDLMEEFKQVDLTCQYIFDELQFILEEGLFIQVDDIINLIQQIAKMDEMRVTIKSCQLIHRILKYFGIDNSRLDKFQKFKNFEKFIY